MRLRRCCIGWFSVCLGLGLLLGLSAMGQASSLCWEFDQPGDTEGWFVTSGSSTAQVSDGVLTYVSDGQASRITKIINNAASDFRVLKLQLKVPVCTDNMLEIQVEFKTDTMADYQVLGVQHHAPTSNLFTVEFDTLNCAQWQGTITNLRIKLNGWWDSAVGDTYQIDAIRLCCDYALRSEFESDMEGWTVSGCSSATVYDGVLSMIAAGNAPRIYRNVSITDPQATPFVLVRYRPVNLDVSNTHVTGRLYADDGSGVKKVGEIKHSIAYGNDKILIFDLRNEPYWQSGHAITCMRFEPDGWGQGAVAGDTFAIQSIAVASMCPQWRWDFNGSIAPNTWKHSSTTTYTTDPNFVIEGDASIVIDTMNLTEDSWVTSFCLLPQWGSYLFPCDGRYEIQVTYRILEKADTSASISHSNFFVWPDPLVGRNVASGRSGSTPIGQTQTMRYWFTTKEHEIFSIKLGCYNRCKVVIDDIIVSLKPQLSDEQFSDDGQLVQTIDYEPYGMELGNIYWRTEFPNDEDILHVMDLADDAGVQWIRMSVTASAELFEELQMRGLKPYGKIPTLEDFNVDINDWYDEIDQWYSICGQYVDYYEFGNEINHNASPEKHLAYINLYIATAQYLKNKDNKNKVTAYGFGKDGITPFKNYGVANPLEKLLENGAGYYMDFLSIHIYQVDQDMIYHINELCRILDQYGYSEMPIYITEIGQNIGTEDTGDGADGTLASQAKSMVNTFVHVLKHPRVQRAIWFNMVFKHDLNADYGICEKYDYVDPDTGENKPFEPRPAYWTLHDMNKLSTTQRRVNDRFLEIDNLE